MGACGQGCGFMSCGERSLCHRERGLNPCIACGTIHRAVDTGDIEGRCAIQLVSRVQDLTLKLEQLHTPFQSINIVVESYEIPRLDTSIAVFADR
jgi:hypothetical protein